MAKRARAESLTGGSGDVNPQYLNSAVATSAANTYTEIAVQMPVQRISPSGRAGKALVMELIRAYVNLPEVDTTNAADTSYISKFALSTASSATMPNLNVPKTLLYMERNLHKAFTATGTYEATYVDPLYWDFTDGAGHGVLVATDNIYLQTTTVAFANPASTLIKILYRWKEVSLTEYIGIVQSQQ